MPAPKLRAATVRPTSNVGWTPGLPAVPANRAVVVSRATVTNVTGSTASFSLRLNPVEGGEGVLVSNLTLSPGESYSEQGLIVPAGASLDVAVGAANSIQVTVCGQEVDN